MELTELAERVLRSDRLVDKLGGPRPGDLRDDRPGSGRRAPPSAPGRPPGLRLDDRRPRARFPTRAELEGAEARGRALHFFANHELLAAELMALCLLRFPEAPPGFRFGVARTLLEEQDHLRRYLARMRALGVELGDVPVGGHFWRALAPMKSPMDYVTGMSLVFEQANLDHAAEWARRFAAAGDDETAALMTAVLADEVGHVKHGATWFERWRAPGDPFAAFREALPPGLDAARARGPFLQRELRAAAGLPRAFVDGLAAHRGSKGRRPCLWVFTAGVEDQLAGRARGGGVRALEADLAPAFGLLGSDEDLVWTPERPDPDHRAALAAHGLPTPRTLSAIEEAATHRPDRVEAWGWSPPLRARLAPVLAATRVAPPAPETDRERLDRAAGLALADAAARRGLGPPGGHARLFDQVEPLEAVAEDGGPWLLKSRLSSSGRHRRRFDRLSDADRAWIHAELDRCGGVILEPWLKRRVDLSLVLGPDQARGTLLRFFTDDRGTYRGHLLGPAAAGMARRWAEPLLRHPEGGLEGLARGLSELVRAQVPEGPVGVDGMLASPGRADPPGPPALVPVVELNRRWTMGHLALRLLRRHLAPGRVGLLWWVRRAELSGGRFVDLAGPLARHAPASRPSGRSRRLDGGVLPLGAPGRARALLGLLAVDASPAAALRRLIDVVPDLAAEPAADLLS